MSTIPIINTYPLIWNFNAERFFDIFLFYVFYLFARRMPFSFVPNEIVLTPGATGNKRLGFWRVRINADANANVAQHYYVIVQD